MNEKCTQNFHKKLYFFIIIILGGYTMLQDLSDIQDDLSDVYRTTVINIQGNKNHTLINNISLCFQSDDIDIIICDPTVIHS